MDAQIYRVTSKLAEYQGRAVGYAFQIDIKKDQTILTNVTVANNFKVSLLDELNNIIATNTVIGNVSLERTSTYNGTSTTFYLSADQSGYDFNSWKLGKHDGKEALDKATQIKIEFITNGNTYEKVLPLGTLPVVGN